MAEDSYIFNWKFHGIVTVSYTHLDVYKRQEYEPYMGSWMDMITIYVVPFGAVLCAIMIYWVLGINRIGEELNTGRKKPVGKLFCFAAKYVYVGLAVLVFIMSIVYKGIG